MRKITLTFDNGPCPETTPCVLEILRERGLDAYFCLVGRQLRKGTEQVDIAVETRARGHTLVNHSYSHGVALGDDPSAAHAQREVCEAHEVLNATLGDWGAPWFRPFGRGGELGAHLLSAAAVSFLRERAYSVLLWNSVPRDWEDPHGWVETALGHVASQEHTVVVLHDLATGAMAELPRFLDTLDERGCQFTTELPGDCVPLRHGEASWDAGAFVEIVTS